MNSVLEDLQAAKDALLVVFGSAPYVKDHPIVKAMDAAIEEIIRLREELYGSVQNEEATMSEHKPCPWEKPGKRHRPMFDGVGQPHYAPFHMIFCATCGACGPCVEDTGDFDANEAAAWAAWDNRKEAKND